MRAHASLRLGSLRGTTPELLVSPWYCAWDFCVVWEAGRPHKTSSPPTQRRNGRAFSSLTARGGGLPVGVMTHMQRDIEPTRTPQARVRDLMTPAPLTIAPATSVHEAYRLMQDQRIGHLPV